MFEHFFHALKQARIPVTLKEYLLLLEAMDADIIDMRVEEFYYLSRTALVKDERFLDRFDQIFAKTFRGIEQIGETDPAAPIPEAWLRNLSEKYLSEEEKQLVESMGGWDKLMEALAERLRDQKDRHEGGNKWIGTGGTSPFGAQGYNPEGVRIGQKQGRHGRAVKVWDKREYKNLDDQVELGTRNIKVALRRLRKFARTGAQDELDLDSTIHKTADRGYLDIVMRPERRNTIKVLLFFDIGGSMDAHIRVCEELFSAARSEFKHMDFFYFHNCLYESVWKDNRRRQTEKLSTYDVLHKFPADYRVIFIGDATMSPYEVTYPGGSVEHWNEEPGAIWLQRVKDIYPNIAWINPNPEGQWDYTASTSLIRDILGRDRMFPMTLQGLDRAMRCLSLHG